MEVDLDPIFYKNNANGLNIVIMQNINIIIFSDILKFEVVYRYSIHHVVIIVDTLL